MIAPALTNFQGHTGQQYISSLQETNGGVVEDPDLASINSVNLVGDASGTFTIAASLGLSIAGGTSTVSVGTLLDQGNLGVQSTGTLNIQGGLTVNSPGVLTTAVGSVVAISGNLLGNTTNADAYSWQGSASFDSGAGTASPPQLLEAMSADLGGVQAGFVKNFAYGTISLTANTSVELVDQSANTTTGKPEAVYASELIVPAGATLDLNNLHLYVRGDQISGTILRGSVTVVSSGGPIALDLPTPGNLTPAGATQNWTFYGTAGESITVQLNPGAGGTNPAIAPYLNWGQVSLRNAGGNTLATASSASSGAFATIAGFTLPASGSYTIQVAAPAAQSTSTGNYVLSAYDVTPSVTLLSVNQEYTGTISNPFSVYRYQFTGAAGQQIELQVLGTSGGSEFDLTGPGSFTAFTNQQTNSSLITLPSSGPYVLTAHGNGSSGGSYAFKVVQTSVSPLTLGTPLSGQTLTASGQALLYAVTVPSTQSLEITLHDAALQDVDQLYAKLGSPPTLVDFSASSSTGSANPQLLVPAAAPGTWYILAYGASVPAASSFTIAATGTPIQLTAAEPTQAPAGTTATLTLTGSGFNSGTTVSLLPMAGSPHSASSVILDTFTQLTATFDLTGVPQGVYSVVASNPGGSSSELSARFTVTAKGGMGMLETHLILPAKMGRHISSTIEVEYSNVGTAAIAAPLLVLESARPQDVPLLTLDSSLAVSGFWTSAAPVGYSPSVEILASGNQVPGWIEPGESVTVPVYYAGMQRPWNLAETNFQFKLLSYTQKDQKLNDWSSVESGLQPPGVSTQAWSAIFAGVQSEIGPTIGDYVTALDNEATYLGQLGQNVTNVGQLWSLAVMQVDGLTPEPCPGECRRSSRGRSRANRAGFRAELCRANKLARGARTTRLWLDRQLAVFIDRGGGRDGDRDPPDRTAAHLPA